MFFRSSSALPRDPTQRRWKLLTSKINWKKQKVRSTSQSRISQMASILSLPGPYLLMNFLLSINLNIWRLPRMFSVEGLHSCPSSPFKCGWIPGRVLHFLPLGRNSWCFHSQPPGWAPQCASNREWLQGSHWWLSQSGNESSVY